MSEPQQGLLPPGFPVAPVDREAAHVQDRFVSDGVNPGRVDRPVSAPSGDDWQVNPRMRRKRRVGDWTEAGEAG